ncbi:biotin--[acetyl-CoA-carboxylase] ligase [Picosynechococcus sp. PCC 11901]|uniref:biotin--[acetyl-CoA-carboxylase] ligase n=1 Tax=Picosynechococcus sp. PCC 11901 TaxID=2579791 RepID=UPI0010FC0107|nr:biotin--[acetyl-CoA-carboxylase] ligase [Picosynechococcus sp. PCC 11901]QCS48749.1 biotin--[acetyl-CoA-carboxylase] ligase [Picosynechococcus sp. PCC 11901]
MFHPDAIQGVLSDLLACETTLPIEVFPELDSTNTLLWQRYQAQCTMPRVAIALAQTAGRGQWGRTWISAPGGLYLSVLLPIELEPQFAYGLTLASVLGIVEMFQQQGLPVQIKWPNDLLLQNKKLGGIKTETKVSQGKISAAVVGVGINYQNPVPPTGINLEQFWQGELKIKGDRLAALVIAGILQGTQKLARNSIENILPGYLKHLKNLGEIITYEGHQGIITGVNQKGELLVKLSAPGASSIVKIPPGQISLGYL